MSRLTLKTLRAQDRASRLLMMDEGDTLYSPGSIVQMVNTTIYTPTAVSLPNNAIAYTNVPDLAATITPKSSRSKIMVQVRWFGEFSASNTTWDSMFGIKRNGVSVGENPSNLAGSSRGIATPVLSYYAADGNSTPEQCSFDFLDSPASDQAVVYQVFVNTTYASTMYTNRVVNAGASAVHEYGSSTITLWEVAQ